MGKDNINEIAKEMTRKKLIRQRQLKIGAESIDDCNNIEYMTLNEAIKTGKLIRYKDWNSFKKLSRVFYNLSNIEDKDELRKIINSKVWEVK